MIGHTSNNTKYSAGDIQRLVSGLTILNDVNTPPFTIEDETDGGEELHIQYRYLDLRHNLVINKFNFSINLKNRSKNCFGFLNTTDKY